MKSSIFDVYVISLTYNIKRSGPSIEPCGTPHVIFPKSEVQLLNATLHNYLPLLIHPTHFQQQQQQNVFNSFFFFFYTVCNSSEDELDIILHGTPEQKRKLSRSLSRGSLELSSSEDEFEKEMERELDDTMRRHEEQYADPTSMLNLNI